MSLDTASLRLTLRGGPKALLLWLTDPRDREDADALADLIHERRGPSFALAGLRVTDWNRDLSPWTAPPVFGDEPFGGMARETLDLLEAEVLPEIRRRLDREGVSPDLPVCVGGYSLAGLFALWAFYESPTFAACAAASPSVWFPGWDAYADAHAARGPAYLSLGIKEPKTRNRQMATVGDAIRRQLCRFESGGVPCALEWNEGNHFTEPTARTAKGFAWALENMIES